MVSYPWMALKTSPVEFEPFEQTKCRQTQWLLSVGPQGAMFKFDGLFLYSRIVLKKQDKPFNTGSNFDQDLPVEVMICKSEVAKWSRIECSFNSALVEIVSIPGTVSFRL